MSEPSKPLPVEPLVYHRDTDASRTIFILGMVGLVMGISRAASGGLTLWYYGFFGRTPTGRAPTSYLIGFGLAEGVGLIVFGISLSCAAISILRHREWSKLLLRYSEQCALAFYLLREIAYRFILVQHNQMYSPNYKVYESIQGLISFAFYAVFPVIALALIEANPISNLFDRTENDMK
jgi:hypothetical protein